MKEEVGGEATLRLSHPAVVVGLVVWVLNDHLFKAAHGTWWTGKLSDVAGLIVFPLLLATILHRWVPRAIEWSIGVTAVLLAAINLFTPAHHAVETGLNLVLDSTLTPDPTDLLTLPALGLSWWLWRQPPIDAGRLRRFVGRLVFAVGLVATVATSSDGARSDRFEGTVILTEAQPEVVIPLSLTKDGKPMLPGDAMRVSVQVVAFGEGQIARTGSDLQETVTVAVADGAVVGEGSVTLRITDPTLAPVQVSYGMFAFYDDSSGDTKLGLHAELPPDESFEPIASWTDAQVGDRGLYAEWKITASADSTLVLAMPSGVDPGHVRLVTDSGRIDHPGGRAVPVQLPEGCNEECTFSLWLAGTPFTGAAADIALYDFTADATVEAVDLERHVQMIELTTEPVRVSDVGTLRWDVDVVLPNRPATLRERAMTFLTVAPDGDGGFANVTGLDIKQFGLADNCCEDIQLTMEVFETAIEEGTGVVSATVRLDYHSPTPISPEEFSVTLRRN